MKNRIVLCLFLGLSIIHTNCKKPAAEQPVKVSNTTVLQNSNYEFTHEHWSEPKVVDLRKQENLDSIIDGAKTDIEIFERLTVWTRKQFQPGTPDPYPLSNGLDILKDIRSKKTGGFCGQYTYLLADALKSFGFFDVRYVEIWKDAQTSHFLLEAWSNQFRKWILLDPLYAATVMNKNSELMSAWQVHAAVVNKQENSLRRNWLAAEAEVPRAPDSDYFALYRLVGVSLRNDLAAMDHPWTVKEREGDFLAIPSPFMKGNYSSVSRRESDFQAPRNLCLIQTRRSSNGIDVHLSNAGTCAHFDHFEVKMDSNNWQVAQSDFSVPSDTKILQCRTVNKMEIRGVIGKTEIKF
ncbi:MAG TPA: transglutaminase domain-containing protein [Acidobacteriota bacterium]|nr:transglutaminase domain-containing protein [Acidobacteriota bacterium]